MEAENPVGARRGARRVHCLFCRLLCDEEGESPLLPLHLAIFWIEILVQDSIERLWLHQTADKRAADSTRAIARWSSASWRALCLLNAVTPW